MKFGMRTPSLKKSIKARTTGKAKRAVKKAVIPGYGKKGTGWLKNPKKAAWKKNNCQIGLMTGKWKKFCIRYRFG